MKRPMAAVGIAYLAAQIIAVAAGTALSVTMCIVSCLIAAASFILLSDKHRRVILPVLVSFAVAFGAYSVFSAVKVEPARQLCGQTVYVRGVVSQQPYNANDRYYYILDTEYIESPCEVQKTTIRISNPVSLEAEVTDIFEGMITINTVDNESFSAASSRLARGIFLTAYIPYDSEPVITEGGRGLPYLVSRMRYGINARIDDLLDGELAAMLNGVLLGDKSGMSSQTISDFRICGLSHLLAVSGLHISILTAALTILLRRTGMHYRAVAGVLIGFVWFYAMLTGFSYSVIRAAIMSTMVLLARVIKREADSLNSLGVAILVICLVNPYAASDAGLLLSASSTFGLIVLAPQITLPVYRFIYSRTEDKYGIIRDIAAALISSVSATVCAMPILMLYFGEYSLISPVANLLCLQLSTVFLVSGAAAVVLSLIPFVGGVLSRFVSVAAWIAGKVMLFIIGGLADIPNASIPVNYSFLPLFFVCAAILLVVWYRLFCRTEKRMVWLGLCAAMMAVVFVSGVSAESIVKSNQHSVTVYDVGDGVAVTMVSGDECIVIGTGGDRFDLWRMTNDLQDRNISDVDAVFYPAADDGYTSYSADFIEAVNPRRVYMPDAEQAGDELAYAVRRSESAVYGVSNEYYHSDDDRVIVNCYTDQDGMIWIYAVSGRMSVLVCPENGNCAFVPQTMKNPVCAVIRSSDITNITRLGAEMVIISADKGECADAQALIRYRGVENVYTTAQGKITVSEHGAGFIVGDE